MTIIFEKDFLTSSRVIMWKPSGEDRQTDRQTDRQREGHTEGITNYLSTSCDEV